MKEEIEDLLNQGFHESMNEYMSVSENGWIKCSIPPVRAFFYWNNSDEPVDLGRTHFQTNPYQWDNGGLTEWMK